MLTAEKYGVPSMGIWEKGKHIRELTKEDIEQLEEQQQQQMIYGSEEEEDGDEDQD